MEPIPRLVSAAVAPTSICLRVRSWSIVGRSLVSFIFPSEMATFYYPLRIACSICMKTLNENMFKIIFFWPHWVRVILAAFTFGETLFLIPLATAWKLEKASLTVRAGFWQTLFWQTLDFCGVDGYGRGRSRSTVSERSWTRSRTTSQIGRASCRERG